MIRHLGRFRIYLVLFLALMLAMGTPASITYGLSAEQKKIYQSGAYLYDEATGDIANAACAGSTANYSGNNAEFVWDYYTAKGLTPVATAGIMGNYSQESGMNPTIKEGKYRTALPAILPGSDHRIGYGLAQWTYPERQDGLFAKMKEAGLEKYYGDGYGNPEIDKDVPEEDIAKLLSLQLDYSWEGDTTKIKDIVKQLNAAKSTTGDSGSAVLFHKIYEGSADTASMIQERVIDATGFLNDFGGTAGTSSCAGELGGVATLEDAIPWGMRFIEDREKQYHPGGRSVNDRVDDSRINLYELPGDFYNNCWGASGCEECTALTGWFVTEMTTHNYSGYRHGNGSEVVGIDADGTVLQGVGLASHGVPTGKEPRPFSIFSYGTTSSDGHTGIVLGVLENGVVITLENNLGAGTLAVRKYSIKADHPDVRFAYMADLMKDKSLQNE